MPVFAIYTYNEIEIYRQRKRERERERERRGGEMERKIGGRKSDEGDVENHREYTRDIGTCIYYAMGVNCK